MYNFEQRKRKELMKATQCNDDIIIKSPIINDPMKNPCIKEQNLSMKCMMDNNYDKEKCTESFENYKMCKKFWDSVYYRRMFQNIKPYLPSPEERSKIKAEYFENLKKLVRGEET